MDKDARGAILALLMLLIIALCVMATTLIGFTLQRHHQPASIGPVMIPNNNYDHIELSFGVSFKIWVDNNQQIHIVELYESPRFEFWRQSEFSDYWYCEQGKQYKLKETTKSESEYALCTPYRVPCLTLPETKA